VGFLDLDILDLLDILLVTGLLYQLYKLVKGTVAIKIFIGLASTYLFWKLVGALQMDVLSEILGQFIGVGVLAVIIVFQQEIRKFLLMIGTTNFTNKGDFFKWLAKPQKTVSLNIKAIQTAFNSMSKSKTGALIIITRNTELGTYESTGEKINAKVGAAVLESIFFKNSPLHDGAVIISKDEIIAARCVLPISELVNLPAHMGLRHRSAASITEMTDALALIVSEETGRIAYFKQGRLKENISISDLGTFLKRDLKNT
jgi:diadenylate cyclase